MIIRASIMYTWFRKLIERASLKKSRSSMTTTNKLTCREVVELVTDYLEESLALEEQMQFEEHVADCPGCTAYIAQVQQSIGMLRRLSNEPVFPETKEELLRVFQEWKRE
jgi:predicted anti-sigma-YlaC factor YlaD